MLTGRWDCSVDGVVKTQASDRALNDVTDSVDPCVVSVWMEDINFTHVYKKKNTSFNGKPLVLIVRLMTVQPAKWTIVLTFKEGLTCFSHTRAQLEYECE